MAMAMEAMAGRVPVIGLVTAAPFTSRSSGLMPGNARPVPRSIAVE
jgi:hypothetical protein